MIRRIPIQCIIPPYMVDELAKSENPKIRKLAMAQLATAAAFRAFREASQSFPGLMASMSPMRGRHRLVHDSQKTDRLPGVLVRQEGEVSTGDKAVDEAYDYSGDTYDFFQTVFSRNSLDDNGMSLISSVHVWEEDYFGNFIPMANAFWNGSQMAFGDGDEDGVLFRRLTRSLDVVAHELSHGVQTFESNLRYRGQPGALNEHFADVFGILVRKWKYDEDSETSDWLVGKEVLVPAPTRKGIRDMENPGKAYENDPHLGTDIQPAHMDDIYTGGRDRGGVHVNSGIPNRAFVLAAKSIGGKPWKTPGDIWYKAMIQLSRVSRFEDCARQTVMVASMDYGQTVADKVRDAWDQVGVPV